MSDHNLLKMLSDLTARVIEGEESLAKKYSRIAELERNLDEINRELDGAGAPQCHVVNRVEWLVRKADEK